MPTNRILNLLLITKQGFPELRKPLTSCLFHFSASIFKPAHQTKQPSVIRELGELGDDMQGSTQLGDDMQGPTQVNWELAAAHWYLGMMHYFTEREKFARKNEVRKAFDEPPIPSFEYAV
ncbi:hypothetical protein AVEN_125240-1 [Araneus ventricosus]|uniref:Uncharacterized protein n=1 Tax=Araneus ventricosus TaxID=182803 RepID=A0A4Y2TKG4_ARAVE|nr:hypothetical protein AVEN_125240-1 [Araneus ventricosus]